MWNKLRNYFISGLVIFLPIALTIYLFILTLGFVDHRIVVIEGVERLGELEGVLGDVSRFAGGDGAGHGCVDFR